MAGAHQEFNPDDIIFREGQEGGSMFVITKGRVKIVRDFGKSNNVLARLSQGEFFGEMSVFSEEPRSATAIAEEATVLLCYTSQEIEALVQNRPSIATRIIHLLGSRLKETSDELILLKEELKSK